MQLSFLSRLIVDYGAEVKVRPVKGIAQHIARVFVDERASGANMLALRLFLEYVIGADFRMAGIPMYSSAATNARRLLMSFRGASSTGAQPTAESELWVAAARGSEGRELGSPVFNPVIGFLALTAFWINIFVAILVITVLRPFGTMFLNLSSWLNRMMRLFVASSLTLRRHTACYLAILSLPWQPVWCGSKCVDWLGWCLI